MSTLDTHILFYKNVCAHKDAVLRKTQGRKVIRDMYDVYNFFAKQFGRRLLEKNKLVR